MLNLPTISGTEALPSLPTTFPPAVKGFINFILDVEKRNLGRKRRKQRYTRYTANCKEIPPLASQQLQRERDRDKFCPIRGPAPLHGPKRAAAVCTPAELGPGGLRASVAWARNEIKAVNRQEKRGLRACEFLELVTIPRRDLRRASLCVVLKSFPMIWTEIGG